MSRAKRVERRLIASREAAQPTIRADCGELVAPTRDNLMRVCLMAHVPHQLVVGRIKDIVEGKRQLHRAKARGQMTRMLGERVYNILPHLDSQLFEVFCREGSKVFDSIDIV